MKRKSLLMLGFGMVLTLGVVSTAMAAQPSQTAQSVMVSIEGVKDAYQIEGSITWTFDRNAAETYYTNSWDDNSPQVTQGQDPAQTSPGAPTPDANKLQQHAQAERCVFFNGGNLTGNTYTQTVNGTRGWKWTYTYTIVPNVASVAAHTAWNSALESNGSVDVVFNGFIASESYLDQSKKTKYSFTLIDPAGSRVRDVSAQLQKQDESDNWVNVGDPLIYLTEGLPILGVFPTFEDFLYLGNAGHFGNAAVYTKLHAYGYGPATSVSAILLEDNFVNNDNDIVNGNVHKAPYNGEFLGLTEDGSYQIYVSGNIKGNDASAGFGFGVGSTLIVIDSCPAQ
jgi:hypothetical protein